MPTIKSGCTTRAATSRRTKRSRLTIGTCGNMTLINLQQIDKVYRLGDTDVPVLKNVSLTVKAGEYVALMGASGSGKTTLMNLLGCLDTPTSGSYCLDGTEVGQL